MLLTSIIFQSGFKIWIFNKAIYFYKLRRQFWLIIKQIFMICDRISWARSLARSLLLNTATSLSKLFYILIKNMRKTPTTEPWIQTINLLPFSCPCLLIFVFIIIFVAGRGSVFNSGGKKTHGPCFDCCDFWTIIHFM